MAIRAIAFDIDGTLYSNASLYLKTLGFGLRHFTMLQHFSRVRYDLHRIAAAPGGACEGCDDLPGFRALQASMLAARSGKSEEEAAAWAERVMYGELEAAFTRVRPFEGLLPALGALRAAGYRLAALSDFPAARKLATLGLDSWFEVAFCSEETGCLKPAPKPFIELARRLGLEPGEILYVGNSLPLDVVGARNAGMGTAYRGSHGRLPRFREPYVPKSYPDAKPDFSFTDWSLLVEHLVPSAT